MTFTVYHYIGMFIGFLIGQIIIKLFEKRMENCNHSISCFFGLHDYKKVAARKFVNRRGLVIEYFKCRKCGQRYQYSYNPNARHACESCGGEEGKCGCGDNAC